MIAKLKDFKFIRHESLAKCAALWCKCTLEEMMEGEHGACLQDGTEVSYTADDMLEGMREGGAWGFADGQVGEVHYWADMEVATPAYLVNLFAHELRHIQSHADHDGTNLEEDIRVEKEAMETGTIAMRAYEEMVKLTNAPATSHRSK